MKPLEEHSIKELEQLASEEALVYYFFDPKNPLANISLSHDTLLTVIKVEKEKLQNKNLSNADKMKHLLSKPKKPLDILHTARLVKTDDFLPQTEHTIHVETLEFHETGIGIHGLVDIQTLLIRKLASKVNSNYTLTEVVDE